MTRLNYVKKARKDYPNQGIARGDAYYWWKFRYGGIQRSKEKPPRSRLTQSDYLGRVYDMQDQTWVEYNATAADVESGIESLRNELEDLLSDTQARLDNMPDNLRDSSESGTLLQERIETIEDAMSELDTIDLYELEEFDGEEVTLGAPDEADSEEIAASKAELRERVLQDIIDIIDSALGGLDV